MIRSVGLISAALLVGAVAAAEAGERISYDRQVRPILSKACFQCHGPDPESRKAGLRLDDPESATGPRRGHAAVVPGDPDASELIRRVASADPNDRMPPPEVADALSDAEVSLLRQWVAEGAEWARHWAFVPPARPELPAVSRMDWVRNPIDRFVLARLEAEGLAPAPEADRVTLLRRLSLDLTGLPPTVEEADRALAGDAGWYAEAAARHLASPHYGERQARHWLDAAQYADSDGFEKDKPRFAWAWRDWVIRAFNANKPYDEFVLEQVAGDLLPAAGQDEIVATGFLRNSMINEEGGASPEQFRMEALFNRMDIIGRAVLGLTVQCAQCHTHKYDPLTHTEYFQMMAFLNNSDEANVSVYSPDEEAYQEQLAALIEDIEADLKAEHPDWRERMAAWEAEARAMPAPDWTPLALEFDDSSAAGQKYLPQPDGSYLVQGYAPTQHQPKMTATPPLERITAVRLELLTDPNLPRGGPGRSIYGALALSEFELRIAPVDTSIAEYDQWTPVPIASAIADVNPPQRPLGPEFPDRQDRNRVTGPIAMAIDGNGETAWTTDIDPARRNQPRYAVFTLAEPLTIPPGSAIAFRLAQLHGGWNSDDNQTNNIGRFRLAVTDSEALPTVAVPAKVKAALYMDPAQRTAAQTEALFDYWRTQEPDFAEANRRIDALWLAHPTGTTQLVYHERSEPRTTHRLERGDFLQPAEAVEPGVPAFLHALDTPDSPDRLDFAHWLVARDAPTTARAFVNRVWQQHFGYGLVGTPSDFGLQGEPPSHPALLDWLAVEFMESGWDVKALHRLIVDSATYRQASEVSPDLLARDPDNRLLARGARFRVEGEVVRDIALSAGGLLNPAVGGPSVYPPAPEYLFQPPASYGPKTWTVATGADRYRRALYTFRFRSVPYPVLQVFDTPSGDAPCTRRERSNSPLQALATLNETLFFECARGLAEETLSQGGVDDAARLAYAFRRCTARFPADWEQARLQQFLDKQRARLAAGELDAHTLLTSSGGPRPASTANPEELAAWTLTARVILNLDETITRP